MIPEKLADELERKVREIAAQIEPYCTSSVSEEQDVLDWLDRAADKLRTMAVS